MSSVCGRLDFKDAESHLDSSSASSPNKCSNGSRHISCVGSEDAQESDGDDSGYRQQNVNDESKDEAVTKSLPESLPLKPLDGEGEDKNLVTVLEDMFSESMSEASIIPAIKGSREKHGKMLEKLRVSWAEDVYDPPPSIVSHTRNKQQQKSKSKDNLKKNGKKGQKGSSNSSSSRGSKDKDKKKSSSSRSKHSRDKFGWATHMPSVAASS